jgi:hypothetical protein
VDGDGAGVGRGGGFATAVAVVAAGGGATGAADSSRSRDTMVEMYAAVPPAQQRRATVATRLSVVQSVFSLRRARRASSKPLCSARA